MKRLQKAFSWNPNFHEYFAVKATPNPWIMKSLKELGIGADCSSMAELVLAESVGITGDQIVFSSNDTPDEEFLKANDLGAIINLDDVSNLGDMERLHIIPERSASVIIRDRSLHAAMRSSVLRKKPSMA